MAVALAGCGGDGSFKKLFTPRPSPQQAMLTAVSDEDPDARREAVGQVAESPDHDADWAVKGFMTIALLDSDTQARCVAIRALGRSSDPRAVQTCLKLLNHRQYPPQEVRPPGDLCRWDATAALADLSEAGRVPDDLREDVRETLLMRLRSDPERHVRIAAARGLGNYYHDDSVYGLIDGLRDEDFAVVYQCELSLVRLTGVTHDCSPYEWKRWLEEHANDPFVNAGNIPASRQRPYSNDWEEAWYDTRQFFEWLYPGSKE